MIRIIEWKKHTGVRTGRCRDLRRFKGGGRRDWGLGTHTNRGTTTRSRKGRSVTVVTLTSEPPSLVSQVQGRRKVPKVILEREGPKYKKKGRVDGRDDWSPIGGPRLRCLIVFYKLVKGFQYSILNIMFKVYKYRRDYQHEKTIFRTDYVDAWDSPGNEFYK